MHDELVEAVKSAFGDAVLETDRSHDDLAIVIDKSRAHDLLVYLRKERDCDLLLDVVGVDLLELDEYRERFEVEYIMYSRSNDLRARVRVPVPETDMELPTATDIWQSANWAERETWEMYGVRFVGHPCLKRLLTHQEFEGYPLRKDYPVMGSQWCATTSDMTDELEEEQGGAPRV